MKVESHLLTSNLSEVAALVRRLKELDNDSLATGKTAHGPFYRLLLAA